ncbi:protein kinase [bacterium]|nr:protein kinase [bacterium]
MEETEQLEKYKIVDELAHSNICTVYRAFDESLNRPVLIKKLHPQMAREDDIRSRFEREAQACAQVKHPNIVDIYGFHVDPENTMLVLEFVEGLSL